MKKYFANMYVNNGTRFQNDLESTNKAKLARSISESARGNCPVGNEFQWTVWDEDGICVAAGAGRKTPNGYAYYNMSELIGQKIIEDGQ